MLPTIIEGYFPGVLGRITGAHALYYHSHWGFDVSFEVQVARELADFLVAFDGNRDGLWAAVENHRLAGSIAIDGRQAESAGARLRWFIVVPELQGAGMGFTLAHRAVAFCRNQGYLKIFLWTFRGLDAARRIYERLGFALCEEHEVFQWGQTIHEQKFELNLQP
jgi:GNAT superfamily N-acetyltransferase